MLYFKDIFHFDSIALASTCFMSDGNSIMNFFRLEQHIIDF